MGKFERAFLLPDLGEGLTSGEISECHIKVGDTVVADQLALVIETTKASVEVPLPFGGEVIEIHGNIGDVIPVGEPLVTLLTDEAPDEPSMQINHLVGQRRSVAGAADQGSSGLARRLPPRANAPRIAASPAVRRLARDLDVDLAALVGTGKGGAITPDDVQAASGTAS